MTIKSESEPEEDVEMSHERIIMPIQFLKRLLDQHETQEIEARAAEAASSARAAAVEEDGDAEDEEQEAASSLPSSMPPHMSSHRVYERAKAKPVKKLSPGDGAGT